MGLSNVLFNCHFKYSFFLLFRYVVGIVFCAEHFLIMCVVLSHVVISDSPRHVQIEVERREYIRKQLLKKLQHKKTN